MRGGSEIVTGYKRRPNPNIYFEAGLALALEKDIIFYLGFDHHFPSDWTNMLGLTLREQSLFPSPEDYCHLDNNLEEMIKTNPFIGYNLKWV
jgi:hypothetical protein